jgi:UDP-N-acetylglucosamine 2-epimerase (non-hydrolysing)
MKILSVVGVRPNIMKFAAWHKAISDHPAENIEHIVVHSGQHYDGALFHDIWTKLSLPSFDYELNIKKKGHAQQVGSIIIELEEVLLDENPDWVIAIDDVNTALATAITAKKLNIKLAHIEAGLRSFDNSMPEEINRKIIDHLSDLLFVPDEESIYNLVREGIKQENICLAGNFMADTLLEALPAAQKLKPEAIINQKVNHPITFPEEWNYALFTLHRPSNVQNTDFLKEIIDWLSTEWDHTSYVFWPIHPGVKKIIADSQEFQKVSFLCSSLSPLIIVEPFDYFEMICLVSNASIVITDSGGLQEETTILGKPCITMRSNTERPITLVSNGGTNRLAGPSLDKIKTLYKQALAPVNEGSRVPLWNGGAAKRALESLLSSG